MKINPDYITREIAGEMILIPVGAEAQALNGMVILNPTAIHIWECLNQNMDVQEILKSLMDKYDVEEDEARADLNEFIDRLKECRLLIEE